MQLMIKGYIGEQVKTTSYAANMYLRTGPQAAIYLHLSREDVLRRQPRMEIQFLQPEKAAKAKRASASKKGEGTAKPKKGAEGATAAPSSSTVPQKRATGDRKGKGKAQMYEEDEDDDSDSCENIDVDGVLEAEGYKSSDEDDAAEDDDVDKALESGIFGSSGFSAQSSRQRSSDPLRAAQPRTASSSSSRPSRAAATTSRSSMPKAPPVINISDSETDSGDGDEGWTTNLRGAPPRKKARSSLENDDGIISLSE